MNAGVSTTPCGVANCPRRAEPHSASIEKLKSVITSRSENHHRVAVRVETIFRLDRRTVRAHRQIIARERRDEHDECRARQVEVGDQAVDDTKFRRRPKENARLDRKSTRL